MIDLASAFRSRTHPIRISKEFRCDLQWWHSFLSNWNGVRFYLYPGLAPITDVEVTSDAAGAVGYGAIFGREWFNGLWFPAQRPLSIAYKELFPIAVAAGIWGARFANRHVLFVSDNEAVVAILNSRTSKIPCIMHLVRHLLTSAVTHNFTFSSRHVRGVLNPIADALSRFYWQEFQQLAPEALHSPSPIPGELLEALMSPLSTSDALSS